MDRNYDVTTFFEKTLILRGLGGAILLTLSKLRPCLLKQSLKTQKKLEELEIVHLSGISICIS